VRGLFVAGSSFLAPIGRPSLAHPYALGLGTYIGGNTRKVWAVIVARLKVARVIIALSKCSALFVIG